MHANDELSRICEITKSQQFCKTSHLISPENNWEIIGTKSFSCPLCYFHTGSFWQLRRHITIEAKDLCPFCKSMKSVVNHYKTNDMFLDHLIMYGILKSNKIAYTNKYLCNLAREISQVWSYSNYFSDLNIDYLDHADLKKQEGLVDKIVVVGNEIKEIGCGKQSKAILTRIGRKEFEISQELNERYSGLPSRLESLLQELRKLRESIVLKMHKKYLSVRNSKA